MVTESGVFLERARGPGGVDALVGALDDGRGAVRPALSSYSRHEDVYTYVSCDVVTLFE